MPYCRNVYLCLFTLWMSMFCFQRKRNSLMMSTWWTSVTDVQYIGCKCPTIKSVEMSAPKMLDDRLDLHGGAITGPDSNCGSEFFTRLLTWRGTSTKLCSEFPAGSISTGLADSVFPGVVLAPAQELRSWVWIVSFDKLSLTTSVNAVRSIANVLTSLLSHVDHLFVDKISCQSSILDAITQIQNNMQ